MYCKSKVRYFLQTQQLRDVTVTPVDDDVEIDSRTGRADAFAVTRAFCIEFLYVKQIS